MNEHPCYGIFSTSPDKRSHRHWFENGRLMPTCQRCGTPIDEKHKEVGPVSWEPPRLVERFTKPAMSGDPKGLREAAIVCGYCRAEFPDNIAYHIHAVSMHDARIPADRQRKVILHLTKDLTPATTPAEGEEPTVTLLPSEFSRIMTENAAARSTPGAGISEARERIAREVLAKIVEADDAVSGARPTSPLGKTTAYYIRDGQGTSVTAWQAIRAMLDFATTPALSEPEQRGGDSKALAEARKRLATTRACLDCNADDVRRWMDTVAFLEEFA
ncbi:hypothetical protein [Sphingomonas xinjiangensis]|uniref:C2H2-type domain-containing protein n=1 Tax=Sphingomonas xinjiangensis TaxID=643568 RepID=A0A840YK44_9SPHN|nr:hypothetical protein [Sphingomonas xinjiangensis]MBB5709290.1 hypothetical protein [Sphingomonas xinjiangensis]